MKVNSMSRLLAALAPALSGAGLACAQQPATPATPAQEDTSEPQKVIYDLAEYNAYVSALNTLDPAARLAAFEAFLKQFPESVMLPEAQQYAAEARALLDNQQTEKLLREMRSVPVKAEPPPRLPSPQEQACKVFKEGGVLSFQEWEFVLQYRDSGAACNKDAATQIWRAIQNQQRSARGEPVKLRLPIQVLSATDRSIDAAITDANQKAQKADLRITMETPMANPPAPGAMVDVIGIISDYSPQPFMFIMTHATLPAPKQAEASRRAR
jgi:hypothetical protein